MRESTLVSLDTLFAKWPILRAPEGATAGEIAAASAELGVPFPDDYREFLLRYGGAVVGPYPVYGLRVAEVMGRNDTVVEVNRHYRDQKWPGTEEWLIISSDHAGNPFGIAPDGCVWRSDHDFGFIGPEVDSFEDFLLGLLV